MTHLRRTLTLAVLSAATSVALLLPTMSAHAQEVVVHDPTGDSEQSGPRGDVTKMVVHHKPRRLKLIVRARSFKTTFMRFTIDTRRPGRMNYTAEWVSWQPRRLDVAKNNSLKDCRLRSGRFSLNRTRITFAIPRPCLDRPGAVRVQAETGDSVLDPYDVTRWSRWTRHG